MKNLITWKIHRIEKNRSNMYVKRIIHVYTLLFPTFA